jgi:hypothetical protein
MALTTVQGELLESGSALENIGAGNITPSYLNTQAQYTGFKNRLINSAMVIDQRNAGASVSTSSGSNIYTLDRWRALYSQTSKFTVQQDAGAVTPPAGFSDYLGVTSSSAYTVGASEAFRIAQYVEGFNFADMMWGTANAQPVTLSFWVRSSLTGTFGGVFTNATSTRSYPYSYTISSANTWEYKTITVAGDTSGTWVGATNGRGVELGFSLGSGSSVSTTANAWATGEFHAPTGATSVVGTSGATFYITGVQLEKGSTATSFDYRPYGTELQLCHRYFKIIAGDNSNPVPANFGFDSTTNVAGDILFPVVMRAKPTLAQTATSYRVNSAGLNQTRTTTVSIAPDESSIYAARIFCGGFSGATAGQQATLRIFESAANSYVAFSAEL